MWRAPTAAGPDCARNTARPGEGPVSPKLSRQAGPAKAERGRAPDRKTRDRHRDARQRRCTNRLTHAGAKGETNAELAAPRWILNDFRSDRLTIQKVPPAYYDASYPCWFLSRAKFLNFMFSHYELKGEFKNEIYLQLGLEQLRYEGMWFERRK